MRFRKLKEARKKWRSNKLTLNVLPWFSGFQKYKMLSAKLTPCMPGVSGELIGRLKGGPEGVSVVQEGLFLHHCTPLHKTELVGLGKKMLSPDLCYTQDINCSLPSLIIASNPSGRDFI